MTIKTQYPSQMGVQKVSVFQWGCNFYDFDLSWLHSGQNRGPTVNFFVLFSRFRLISQARKVEMTHFKRPKSSTGCGQCREALGKGPTPSGGSGMHQERSLFWRNCARAGNFLGRSYCLQVANMIIFPLTANVPINRLTFPLIANVSING